jgi:hypothetical protein
VNAESTQCRDVDTAVGEISPLSRVRLMNQKQIHGKFGAVADILTTLKLLGVESESFNSMLDEFPVNVWVHDDNYTIVYENRSFRENFGAVQNKTCHQCLMHRDSVCSCCLSRQTFKNKDTEQCKLCKRNNFGYDFNLFHTPINWHDGRVCILKTSLYIEDLSMLAESSFSGTGNRGRKKKYIVMCASCKRIKDRDNNWIAVDNTFVSCFNVRISHGICRECAVILYPTLDIRGLH